MTKEQIIAELKKKKIAVPENATDEELQKLLDEANAAKPEKQPKMVKVRVTGQPVCEGGQTYGKGKEFANGDSFSVTEERAKALGPMVEVIA